MKRQFVPILFCLIATLASAQSNLKTTPTIYIDKGGVMRWTDSRQEASFYGVNYTLPFAHAYRATGYLGADRKAAIDKDVYHFARLGLNAYRIHLWDVELTDGQGHLIENEHLDLMDYLISKLKERGIRIMITAQTNFGNGYPERNQPTGGFSYQYDKCSMHSDPEAIAAQEQYLGDLVQHTNPYTKIAYKDDPYIVGFEINNEPCHSGTKEEVKAYINRMLEALKEAGNRKPVFYNVSHNGYVVDAFYDTAIQGTTYQWYPIGLVAGHTQQGNFLPYVDRYDIPFSQVKGFNKKARMVYEFDPADILYSYMYPAMTRTFRTAGFQWITQFAYDPMDMAWANTEYQTHFLNLAYTPQKAISMKIAAEAARRLARGASYGSYPQDTLFGDGFRVSYTEDLSELNNGDTYIYSNTTKTLPKSAGHLQNIAGCGSSPVIRYEGTGAYFADRLESGVWRLEVMPDAVVVNDPFAKPSLKKEVVTIAYGRWDMRLSIPDLGDSFTVTAINSGNDRREEEVTQGMIRSLQPGVYLLQRTDRQPSRHWDANATFGNIRLGEYAAPAPRTTEYKVVHCPATVAEAGKPLTITAEIVGPQFPDSVIIYTDKISFWNEKNPSLKMKRINGYTYQAMVSAGEVAEGCFRYNIVVCHNDKYRTFPAEGSATGNASGTDGSPLDWDYTSAQFWATTVVASGSVVSLPLETNVYHHGTKRFLRTYIKEAVANRKEKVQTSTRLCIRMKHAPQELHAGFITSDGYTYSAACPAPSATDGIIRLPLSTLKQTDTALLPVAYPEFLPRYFHPVTEIPFNIEKVEKLELSFDKGADQKEAWIEAAWIE